MSKIKAIFLNNVIKYYIKIAKIKPLYDRPKKISYDPQNILAISNTALGDTILSTPALKALRSSYPKANIYLLVDSYLFGLFEGYEFVTKTIPYKKNIFYLFKLILYFRKLRSDTTCILHANGPEDLFLAFLSGSKSITKSTRNTNHPFNQYFLNKPDSSIIHVIDNRIHSINQIINVEPSKELSLPTRYTSSSKYILNQNDRIEIGFQLGASSKHRMWPLENFKKLGARLINEFENINIVLIGSNSEKALAKSIEDFLDGNVTNVCGKTSIDELPYLIKNLDLLVTNDTGTLHLAIALKTRSISLFGASNPKITGPHQDPQLHTVIYKDVDVTKISKKDKESDYLMKRITVDEVFDAATYQIQTIIIEGNKSN